MYAMSDQGQKQIRKWRSFVRTVRDDPELRSREHWQEHWRTFQRIFADRPPEDGPPVVWEPGEAERTESNLAKLLADTGLDDYDALHAHSLADPRAFWGDLLDRLGVRFHTKPRAVVENAADPLRCQWFPGAELDPTESCFQAPADRPAVVSGKEGSDQLTTTTYGELRKLVERIASGLLEMGFRPGDAIALYMPMTVECVAAYLGVIRAGCRVLSIADSFSPREVRRRLDIGKARGVITVERYQRGDREIELYEKLREALAPRTVVIPATKRKPKMRAKDFLWARLLEAGDRCAPRPGPADDVTNVLFSSGTTGTPKAIPWTRLTPFKCASDGHLYHDLRPTDVLAWPTNIGWMMGPWLIYAGLVNGATLALYEGAPTGRDFATFIEKAGVTVLGLIPSLVRHWRTTGATEESDWSRIRLFSSTGEASGVADYLWLMSTTGYRAPVIEYCGGTEIGGAYITGTVLHPASPATFTAPALGHRVVLVDEQGRTVEGPGTGEVYLAAPSLGLSQRLLNADHDEVYFEGTPSGPDGEILRRHGDLMARLPGGFYRAQGRADDSMNLAGIKISSRELEKVAEGHEAVYESAAVVVPDPDGGDRLVLWAVTAEDVDPDRLHEELQQRIGEDLNPLFRIHELRLLERLPRTASNKVLRRELRERARTEVSSSAVSSSVAPSI